MSGHTCHAASCNKAVPPRIFMCRAHWFQLPKEMRDAVNSACVPGQWITKTPTREYVRAARDAVSYIAEREAALHTGPQ